MSIRRQEAIYLQICQHQFVVIPACQKVVSRRRETHRTDIGRMRLKALNSPIPSDIVKNARGILMSGNH